jgi:hypothetical protein
VRALGPLLVCGLALAACEPPPPETPRLDDETLPDVVGTWTGEVEEDRLRYKLVLTIDHLEPGADGRIDVRLRSDGRLGWLWYRSTSDRVPDARATLDRR